MAQSGSCSSVRSAFGLRVNIPRAAVGQAVEGLASPSGHLSTVFGSRLVDTPKENDEVWKGWVGMPMKRPISLGVRKRISF